MHSDNMLSQQLLHGKGFPAFVAEELGDVEVLHNMVLQPRLRPDTEYTILTKCYMKTAGYPIGTRK